ncbi:MAG: hypothetical protein Q4B36_00545 [Tissierellia bacterium]|nr:hypothetical protein [Tissierellia bacterium]
MKKLANILLIPLIIFSFTSCANNTETINNKDLDIIENIKIQEDADGLFTYETYNLNDNDLISKQISARKAEDNLRIDEFFREDKDIIYIFEDNNRTFIDKQNKKYYTDDGPSMSLIDRIRDLFNSEDSSLIEETLNYNQDYNLEENEDGFVFEFSNGDYIKYDKDYILIEKVTTSDGTKLKEILTDKSDDVDSFYNNSIKITESFDKVDNMSEVTGK